MLTVLFLLGVGSVGAVSLDDSSFNPSDISVCDVCVDNCGSILNESNTGSISDCGSGLNESNMGSVPVLSSSTGSFSELQSLIDSCSGSSLTLSKNYSYHSGDKCIRVGKSITIKGNGFVLDAKDKVRIFNITAGHVALEGIVFKNGHVNSGSVGLGSCGGAIFWDGSYGSVNNCTFTGNYARVYGGAIYADTSSSKLTIKNSNFKSNVAGVDGGGLFCNRDLSLVNSVFTSNYIQKGNNNSCHAGAIYLYGDGSISGSRFVNNSAVNHGGAIYLDTSIISISNCYFKDNTANESGAIFLLSSKVNITESNFTGNTAKTKGGALGTDDDNKTVRITNSNFNDNTAKYGGAFYNTKKLTLSNCNFTNNNANYGGAIYTINNLTISNSNFKDNNAVNGSAIYNTKELKLSNCYI